MRTTRPFARLSVSGGAPLLTQSLSGPIIRVEAVHHTYLPDSPMPVHALRGVDLTIRRGEYLAIVGHNGSGKSTLARHLNALLLPSRGDVWVMGSPSKPVRNPSGNGWNTRDASHRLDIRSTVGMVFQSPDSQIVATIVEEDVAFGPENLGVPRPEIRARIDWALDTVEMQSYRWRAPHLLSGGQKQRVAIAGILAMKPQVLILDESTALLDPLGRNQVLAVARHLNKEGVTIVAITHMMHEAVHADRVLVMEEGKIALEGTPREVFAQADRLHALQLDVPEITQLASRLHHALPYFPADILTIPEFISAVEDQNCVPLRDAQPSGIPNPGSLPSQSPTTDLEPQLSQRRGEPVISIRDLEYTYLKGTPLESVALRGVNLEVRRGEIVGIIGHTGSGKSTVIQHLNGLLRPQRGSVRVLENDLADPHVDLRSLRRRVGVVFQFPEAQLFERYVGDDVAFGPYQMGLRGTELRERVRAAMAAVGLPFGTFKDRPIYSLSGGERRRAALAGVLAIRPEILVLDEPTAGLDPRGHQDILARLMGLHREGRQSGGLPTLVIISHNMEDIARWCDYVYVLSGGRTVVSGSPRQIFSAPERLTEYGLGVPQATAVMHALRQKSMHLPADVLTVDEAEAAVLKVLDGRI